MITIQCDECKHTIDDLDELYCSTCYQELQEMIKERDAEISSLQKEIEILNDALDEK